ncbi:MAG TPA: transglycosylase SLT domain-containing protein [Polyangia bacterium]|nr:transglycosylase SLT domain-containing protein [Polyangia bacterium]
MATIMISAVWDPVIEKYAGRVPVAFIRALVHGESGGNSQKENPTSHAAGLLQITEIVRQDWNSAHADAPVTRDQLFDPEINVRLGAALLNRIVQVYGRHPTMRPDWKARRYAELVALGWNAGYSDHGGVGLAVTELEAAGGKPDDVTVDTVAKVAASLPAASRFVSKPDRVAYAKAVADLYLGSRRAPVVTGRPGAVGPVVVAALGAFGLAHFGRRGLA